MNDEERALDLQLGDALAENRALKAAIQKAINLLGPTAPDCCGCEYEWNQAITQLQAALGRKK
tara:strand:+ start:25399 stop:25587 length:189 start_codon:yes stop_codon:yes gene_type:complete